MNGGPLDRLNHPHPSVFLFLNLPFGITSGYTVVAVPFLATRAGLSVVTAASIVAIGLAPKATKLFWSPVVDIGWTLKSWYAIGASLSGFMLLIATLVPLTHGTVPFVTAALFSAAFGSSLLAPTLGALMADTMPDKFKGRAAGWYQLGGKIGRGVGGGAGLWLAVHATTTAAGLVLGLACFGCIFGLRFLPEPERRFSATAVQRVADIGRELWQLIRSREGALVAALAVAPIGVSGVDDFWSGIATEWRVPVGTVALVTGFASAVVAAAGCLFAGWWADRQDHRVVFLSTGTLVAVATATLALAPRVPQVFIAGTLAQKLFIGMSDAAMSALILGVIGRSAAATKFTLLAALGNVSEMYMTVTSGWVHDRWSTTTMLVFESASALALIGVAALFLKQLAGSDHVRAEQMAVIKE